MQMDMWTNLPALDCSAWQAGPDSHRPDTLAPVPHRIHLPEGAAPARRRRAAGRHQHPKPVAVRPPAEALVAAQVPGEVQEAEVAAERRRRVTTEAAPQVVVAVYLGIWMTQ